MDFMANFLNNITKYSVISIIGLAKNVSKTTTLNYIIRNLKGYKLGLTSIGRDGEKYDIITQLPKPRIFIKKGTIVATARKSFEASEVKMKILKKTRLNTPLGEILLLEALSDGLIELAGPSINSEVKQVCDKLLNLGCDLVLIDGAFDRRSFASPLVSQATILSTGASVSRDFQEVIQITKHTFNLLTLKSEENEKVIKLANKIINDTKVGIIFNDFSIKKLELSTALDSVEDILTHLDTNSKFLVINGAITDLFLEKFMEKSDIYKDIEILVSDTTKLFLSKGTFTKFSKKGGTIKTINKIKIIMVTINPTSPLGYEFDKSNFLIELKKGLPIPIYDLGPSEY